MRAALHQSPIQQALAALPFITPLSSSLWVRAAFKVLDFPHGQKGFHYVFLAHALAVVSSYSDIQAINHVDVPNIRMVV